MMMIIIIIIVIIIISSSSSSSIRSNICKLGEAHFSTTEFCRSMTLYSFQQHVYCLLFVFLALQHIVVVFFTARERSLARGLFRPRQTRQLPRAVDLKGWLLSCQSY